MGEWLYGVLAAAVTGAFVCALLPEKKKNTGRVLRFLSSLCVLAMMLSPLSGLVEKARKRAESIEWNGEASRGQSGFGEKSGEDWLLDEASTEISRQIAEYAESRYGVSRAENIRVLLRLDTSDKSAVKIKSIVLDLRGCIVTRGVREMEEELSSMLETEVTVLVR